MITDTVGKTDVMINPARRYFSSKGSMSACLLTGTEKVRSGYGNGDCILADFRSGLFAVADATERFSRSSREFLERLLTFIRSKGVPVDRCGWNDCFKELYGAQEYIQKTTVTCVAIGECVGVTVPCRIMSGGDSAVSIVDVSGEEIYRTKVNMNFAGRSPDAAAVEDVTIDRKGTRMFIYTDGYLDIRKRLFGDDLAVPFPHELSSIPVNDVASFFIKRIAAARNEFEHDDMAVVALDVDSMASKREQIGILLGGTTPSIESRFQNHLTNGSDRMLSESEWFDDREMLERAGFSICDI